MAIITLSRGRGGFGYCATIRYATGERAFTADWSIMDALNQAKQMEQAQQGMQMAQPVAGMAAQGANAMKSLAEGDASTGGGISKMIATMKDHIAANPQAQQGLEAMMNGQSPN